MTFKEEFPSMKDVVMNNEWGVKTVPREAVYEHCLDKQRVKKAIDKVNSNHQRSYTDVWAYELLKELGLED